MLAEVQYETLHHQVKSHQVPCGREQTLPTLGQPTLNKANVGLLFHGLVYGRVTLSSEIRWIVQPNVEAIQRARLPPRFKSNSSPLVALSKAYIAKVEDGDVIRRVTLPVHPVRCVRWKA